MKYQRFSPPKENHFEVGYLKRYRQRYIDTQPSQRMTHVELVKEAIAQCIKLGKTSRFYQSHLALRTLQ